ncbi:uncharacterized protein LOC132565251 [Ylistrum balloti]|uniref:uncharacterized protein LOC132565251 n=1 Tax=Ylistrum balloti TaxID=509963 RepID=UPI002905A96C|nr:uncharacterized protein LOC132565251 [Ylistrum balloti]
MKMADMETDASEDPAGDVRQFSQHKLLLEVDSELDSEDIENMKFLCQDVIPLSKLQKIDRGIDLFVQLENANKISPKKGDLELLFEILFRVRRLDLVKKLGKNSKEVKRKYGSADRALSTNLSPFRNMLYELVEELTQEDFATTKFVLQSEFGKGTMAKIKTMMDFFTFLQREQELELDDVDILYRIMDILKRSDLKQKIQEYENYPYKKGRPGPPLPPVAGLGPKPTTQTPNIIDLMQVQTASNPASGVMVSASDHEMMDTSQNVLPPAPAGSKIPDNYLMSISIELAKELRWRMLCAELDISIDDLDEITATGRSTAGKIYLMLSYWRDTMVNDNPNAGQMLYLAMYKANFQVLALNLALKNLFPGVVMEPIPSTTEENKETGMEEQVNPPTQPIPTPTPPNDSSHEISPAVARVSPCPQDPSSSRQENMTENIAIHGEEAQLSILNPSQSTANQPEGVQHNLQPGLPADGRMSGGQELPREPINETEQQRQDNELIRQMQRAHVDNEIDLPSYKMDAKPRGVCVIINNEKFYKVPGDDNSKEMPNRVGTQKDAERLRYIFQKLDFIVETFNDQTDFEIAQVLSSIGYRNHERFDCFVCCILTHGAAGHIFGSNGKMLRIDILTGFFRAQLCPTLAGKPKLFFIQACQGREKQGGYDIEADAAVMRQHPSRQDIMVDINGREMIPDEADYILGYATVPGYVSYRSRSQGSWFINKLVDMLDKYAYRYDLLSVLVKVNEEVGNAIANIDGGRYKQIPAPLVTLRKRLCFR